MSLRQPMGLQCRLESLDRRPSRLSPGPDRDLGALPAARISLADLRNPSPRSTLVGSLRVPPLSVAGGPGKPDAWYPCGSVGALGLGAVLLHLAAAAVSPSRAIWCAAEGPTPAPVADTHEPAVSVLVPCPDDRVIGPVSGRYIPRLPRTLAGHSRRQMGNARRAIWCLGRCGEDHHALWFPARCGCAYAG